MAGNWNARNRRMAKLRSEIIGTREIRRLSHLQVSLKHLEQSSKTVPEGWKLFRKKKNIKTLPGGWKIKAKQQKDRL